MPARLVLRALSPAGPRGRLSIFIFHRVHPAPDPLAESEPDVAQFDRILGWIGSACNVLPMDRAIAGLRAGTLPARAAAITFDDGYADNHDLALPVLLRHGMSATFFIATGYLDGGRMWNDTVIEAVRAAAGPRLDLRGLGLGDHPLPDWPARRTAIEAIIGQIKYRPIGERIELAERVATMADVRPPADLMMTSAQVVEMRRAGMIIGAHTVSHPILARLDSEAAREEIVEGRRTLEHLLGEPVRYFAYPNGRPGTDYLPEQADLVRQLGFEAAFSTAWGAADGSADLMQLPRFTPWDRTRAKFLVRVAINLAGRNRQPAHDAGAC